jgi:hypothetical protein
MPSIAQDSSMQKIRKQVLQLANLQDLQNGFNELQIRVWLAYSGIVENVLIFAKINNRWEGSSNRLEFSYDSVTNQLVSIKRESKLISPKSGWQVFTDSLLSFGVADLPDMTDIPGYGIERDGSWITIEYANCKVYRLYSYQTPWALQDKFTQAKKIVDISNLIERQFGLLNER